MGCCGQNRAALSRRLVGDSTSRSIEIIEPPVEAGPPVRLHYEHARPILVRGPATGRVYQFSDSHPDGNVDTRDAVALLRTRLFRQLI
jgi:hypothetical protein